MLKIIHKRKPCSEKTKKKISIANKGRVLTKEHKTKISINNGKGFLGRCHTQESKQKMHDALKGRKAWNKGIKGQRLSPATEFGKGHKPWNWQNGISKTKERKSLYAKTARCKRRKIGRLSVKAIQLVYEDNIKQYGTLTCYLCLQPIEFGNDNLEHKTPISRGGTNEYNNLAVACRRCNSKKHTKTVEEFKNVKA